MRVDLSGVDAGSFDAIPSGAYQVKVTDGEIRQSGENSKNPGSDYINWEFEVTEGDFAGRKLWSNTSLLPQALFGLKGLLIATGQYSEEELSTDLDFEINDVIGADVTAVVAIRNWQGDDRNEIKRFKPAGAAASTGSATLLP